MFTLSPTLAKLSKLTFLLEQLSAHYTNCLDSMVDVPKLLDDQIVGGRGLVRQNNDHELRLRLKVGKLLECIDEVLSPGLGIRLPPAG